MEKTETLPGLSFVCSFCGEPPHSVAKCPVARKLLKQNHDLRNTYTSRGVHFYNPGPTKEIVGP